jgi:uncharacterized protein (TIGR03437 family)
MNRITGYALLSCWSFCSQAIGQVGMRSMAAAPESQSPETAHARKARLAENCGKLPLSFEANIGQADKSVKFFSRGGGYGLYLTGEEAVLALRQSGCAGPVDSSAPRSGLLRGESACAHQTDVVRMRLAGASHGAAAPVGEEQLPGTANYFVGNDPSKWYASVPTYAKVRYRGVYPGVDLVYYGNQRQLEYDFVVAPDADPKPIRLRFSGAKGLRLGADGDLVVTAADGAMTFHKPVVYQLADGQRRAVNGSFALLDKNTVGFRLGSYDRGKTLVIDPVLVYSTYLGGSGGMSGDYASAIAVDAAGNTYVAGSASSPNFPLTQGANQTKYHTGQVQGGFTTFVTKLNSTGSAPIYSTYLGGSGGDWANGLALDGSGNAYITGETYSTDFPVTAGAYETTDRAAANYTYTGFVSKLNPTGSALVYSTYLGGSGYKFGSYSLGDYGMALAVDGAGSAYITGITQSKDFPVTAGAYQSAYSYTFITKLNPAGSALVYSTFLGGNSDDYAYAVAVDGSGNAYVAGRTDSTLFPVTAGAFQTTNRAAANRSFNAFITKLNSAGGALVYSTYLGGSDGDYATGLALDSSGNVYVTGGASSTDFPVTEGAFQTSNHSAASGEYNAFVTKLNSTGSALVYSTYLGGSSGKGVCGNLGASYGGFGRQLAVDGSGNAYVVGSTFSTDFPVTTGAFQTANNGTGGYANPFVAELNSTGSALLYSTYLGGSDIYISGVNLEECDYAYGLAIDGSGNAYIAGDAYSTNFPVTQGAFQTTNHAAASNASNAFVTKLNLSGATTGPTATITSLSPESALAGGAGFTLTVNGTNFATGSTVNWGSATLTTTFLTAAKLAATVPASLIATAGTVSVTVTSNGAVSNALAFTVATPQACLYSVSPLAPSTVAATGGTITITIQTGPSCGWSVSALPGWITVSGNSSGVGSATVTLVVGADTGAAVSANIIVAGQTVTVAEAGAQSGIITTVAGNGTAGFSGDGGPAASASLDGPGDVAVDASGNLYISDDNRIRKVSTSGIITTYAGIGPVGFPGGFSGDGGPATSASIYAPRGIVLDASGNLFFADSYNQRIRKVSASGIITTVAGNGYGAPDLGGAFSGDGGPATSAELNFPIGVALDGSGSLFIADSNNQRIRKVSVAGTIATVAGNPGTCIAWAEPVFCTGFSGDGGPATSALFDQPMGVAVDAAGNLFIADEDNNRIRKVSASGIITTVAGNGVAGFSGDGGQATSAELNAPTGVAVDASGNLFVVDYANNRIRKVSAGGIITTVAGNGIKGFSGDGGFATSASLGPCGIAVDTAGDLFIAECTNNRVRKVSAPVPLPSAPSISPGGIVPVGSTATTIQPGEWVSIYGTNLASSTATWNGNFPTSLGGTTVTIDGKPAYLSLVSPGQINLQAPTDTATGSVPVVVTTAGGSATATVTMAQVSPSFFLLDAKHAAGIIIRSNGLGAYGGGTYDILGPTGNSLGYATVAAKAGDTVELFATGLGPTNPVVPAGQAYSGAAPTTNAVTLRINNLSVSPGFAGLSGAGLYQINLTVPAGLGTGDVSLVATVGGTQTQTGVVISLQ